MLEGWVMGGPETGKERLGHMRTKHIATQDAERDEDNDQYGFFQRLFVEEIDKQY